MGDSKTFGIPEAKGLSTEQSPCFYVIKATFKLTIYSNFGD